MKRGLIIACAGSAMVLAYAAHAGGSGSATPYGLTINASVPGFCNITGKGIFGSGSDYDVSNISGGKTVTFTSFASPDGTGQQASGSLALTVNSNAQCDYTLTSAYGAMKNLNHLAAFRPYYAVAYQSSSSATPVYLNSLANNKTVNTFSVSAPVSVGNNGVQIDVNIPASGILAAGSYQDTLTLSITPRS